MNENSKSVHEQFADDLALYALGSLSGSERDALERHLAGCAACRRELDGHRGDVALLALSFTASHPPQRSRDRLLSAIAHEPHGRSLRALAVRRPWWSLAPVFATLLLAIFGLLLWREDSKLKQRLEVAEAELIRTRIELAEKQKQVAEAQEILAMLHAPEAVRVTLSRGRPEPQGKAFYIQHSGHVMLLASNLPPISPAKAYQLWVMPMHGPAIPAGTFKPNPRGEAAMEHWVPAGTQAKGFGVTVEDERGATVPTAPVLLAGTAGAGQ